MNHTILITGGSGFIGSNFIRWIYDRYPDYRIFNLDALTYAGNPENLIDVEQHELGRRPEDKRYHFINGDVCDGKLLDALFGAHKFQLVIHFAAETHVDRSLINAANFIRTNIEGTRSLMES
ncbi:MAG: GDP-mannose 4,6-dehydratase, partial [Patescibacteria group bacterium]